MTYPVAMADWTGTGIAGDTFVNNAAYPNGSDNDILNRILVGKSNSGTVTWRGYIRFNVPPPLLGGTAVKIHAKRIADAFGAAPRAKGGGVSNCVRSR
ncbi:hypothetical protein Msi02_49310 [Microbispora siamensis]|uniref:Uncharacterized protein n=1 Tax=Microbispora siamensis TaxID=564413 RepID=A0ABQ4GRR7_9ACTN|nr:hypothetical protein Msi02_49310 [Microbispora siamensis]